MNTRLFISSAVMAGFISISSSFAQIQSAVDEIYAAPIRAYIEHNVKPWLSNPLVIEAINKQNMRTSSLQKSEILSLDKQWSVEITSNDPQLIDEVLSKDLSKFLIKKQAESDDMLLEIFVMDAVGLNVGQSKVTTDYWQGDEAKWINTYLKGPDVLFIEDVAIDESTQNFQFDASLSISDPETGKVIGAITLGFSFEKL